MEDLGKVSFSLSKKSGVLGGLALETMNRMAMPYWKISEAVFLWFLVMDSYLATVGASLLYTMKLCIYMGTQTLYEAVANGVHEPYVCDTSWIADTLALTRSGQYPPGWVRMLPQLLLPSSKVLGFLDSTVLFFDI